MHDDIAQRFRSWTASKHSQTVFRIEEIYDEIYGCTVSVKMWDPSVCQGRYFPRFVFACFPSQDMFWSRLTPDVWKQTRPRTKEQSLRLIFDIVFQADLGRVEITALDDDEATNILYEKLLNNPNITTLEYSNSSIVWPSKVKQRGRRAMDLCCKLVANSSTLKGVLIENAGKLDRETVEQLFLSLQKNTSLKVLDMRSSRYLESWYKSKPRNEIRDKPNNPIYIKPLISALLSSQRQFKLRNLDLGGNVILSTAAICSLAKSLPSLDLNRLSLRGCSLTETSLLAIAKSLETNKVLTELDLSHNTCTTPVLEELTNSLEYNRALKRLRLEHCNINFNQIEWLLSTKFDNFKYLQHLHLDGNEFTWETLQGIEEEEEASGASLLLEALEKQTSLLTLEMGEFGKVRPFSGLCCCKSLPYSILLSPNKLERLVDLLKRNRRIQNEMARARAHQAIVRISKLLLSKMVIANSDHGACYQTLCTQ
jgi:hypothetical protein